MNNSTIRLLVVCGSLRVGGAEMQAARMLPRLDRSRFDLEVAYYNHPAGPPKEALEAQGVPVTFLGNSTWDRKAYFRQAIDFMRNGRFDLVHGWSASANHYGRLPALIAGVPIVVGGLLGKGGFDGIWPYLYSAMNLVCSGWIVNSEDLRKFASNKLFLNRFSPIVVVPNGIELGQDQMMLAQQIPAYASLKRNRPIVGLVGRLHPVKNHSMLLNAALILRDQGVAADFWIVGDGPERGNIARQINDYQLGDCVHMLGQREDVEAAYEIMDVVVLTSHSEGCPNVLLEAMRAARPLVATRCTSLDNVIDDGVNGFLVGLDSAAELADRLKLLLANEALRKEFGMSSRRMVEKTFSMPVAIRQLEEAYLGFAKAGMVRHPQLQRKLAALDAA